MQGETCRRFASSIYYIKGEFYLWQKAQEN